MCTFIHEDMHLFYKLTCTNCKLTGSFNLEEKSLNDLLMLNLGWEYMIAGI